MVFLKRSEGVNGHEREIKLKVLVVSWLEVSFKMQANNCFWISEGNFRVRKHADLKGSIRVTSHLGGRGLRKRETYLGIRVTVKGWWMFSCLRIISTSSVTEIFWKYKSHQATPLLQIFQQLIFFHMEKQPRNQYDQGSLPLSQLAPSCHSLCSLDNACHLPSLCCHFKATLFFCCCCCQRSWGEYNVKWQSDNTWGPWRPYIMNWNYWHLRTTGTPSKN